MYVSLFVSGVSHAPFMDYSLTELDNPTPSKNIDIQIS